MHSGKQRRSLNEYGRKVDLTGGVLLGTTAVNKVRVRNMETDRVLPCCWHDCMVDGDDRVRVEVPHDHPRFPGEKLVYIFCSESHKTFWLMGVTR